MALPKAPKNFYVNRRSDISVLVWDKVIKDVEQNYTNVIAYHVYRTANPARREWEKLHVIITPDSFGDIDTFFIDFDPGNFLYRVCPENSEGIGNCAVSYGLVQVIPDEEVEVDNYLIWNDPTRKWNQKLWK